MSRFSFYLCLILAAVIPILHAGRHLNQVHQGCGSVTGSLFVEDTLTLDVDPVDDCQWIVETQEDRILLIKAENVQFQLGESLNIHDGLLETSPILFSSHSKELSSTGDLKVYSTGRSVLIRLNGHSTNIQLKIQKAVDCPFNLGVASACGRVLDEVSCHCATFAAATWDEQRTYCKSHSNFVLVSLETEEEHEKVFAAWQQGNFWMSLNDKLADFTWIWDSLSKALYPGWASWCRGEPSNLGNNENCAAVLALNGVNPCWHDYDCSTKFEAVCEAKP